MTAVKADHRFTVQIVLGMLLGIVVGLLFKYMPFMSALQPTLVDGFFDALGEIFLNLIMMLVVPIVIVSLVCGAAELKDMKTFGRVGGKALGFYLITTAMAILLALLIANFLHVGGSVSVSTHTFTAPQAPSIKSVFVDMFPSNPFYAFAQGHMLQIVVFSLLLGLAIASSGDAGAAVARGFHQINTVMIRFVMMVIRLAPLGVFCLLAVQFSHMGWQGIIKVSSYFFTVVAVLFVQTLLVYPLLLTFLARLSPIRFFKKLYSTMLFAFSVSSSSASIPVTLNAVKNKMGVGNKVASFVIPVGATINMDGTAIMQGVATVFIANVYGVHLGVEGYLMVILMATLSSIGTAGVPSVGLITLTMVLQQVGLPVDGIALIFGVDRLLDMLRTAVNIAGDSTIACIVARSERAIDLETFNATE